MTTLIGDQSPTLVPPPSQPRRCKSRRCGAGCSLRVEWLWQQPLPPVLDALRALGLI
jgi:hypothetical protein